jgi:hypothetical protein
MGENIAGLTTMEAGRKGIETIRQLNRDLGDTIEIKRSRSQGRKDT